LLVAVSEKGDESGRSFKGSIGAIEPKAALTSDEVASLDMTTIATGTEVDLEDHLVKGKFTIFDYYADWCGPCLQLAKKIERHASTRDDIAIRKIDIVTWKTPAAVQATKKYKLAGLPYLRIYGPDGKLRGVVDGDDIEAVKALLR
jgi:thiol:disulfide interchange protein